MPKPSPWDETGTGNPDRVGDFIFGLRQSEIISGRKLPIERVIERIKASGIRQFKTEQVIWLLSYYGKP